MKKAISRGLHVLMLISGKFFKDLVNSTNEAYNYKIQSIRLEEEDLKIYTIQMNEPEELVSVSLEEKIQDNFFAFL